LRNKGDIAEQKACEFLTCKGFMVLERNFYAKKIGEIDIIATKGGVYHFVEVKSANTYEIAVNNITQNKLVKLKRSISYYLQNKKLDVNFCLHAIIVIGNKIEFLENITF